MNGYKEAIEVLKQSEGRSKDLLLWEVAKISPSSIVKAAKSIGIIHCESLEESLKKMVMNSTDKIWAIKKWREMTGEGLKESKNAVEKIRSSW